MAAALVPLACAACSHDWDLYDPPIASASTAGSSTGGTGSGAAGPAGSGASGGASSTGIGAGGAGGGCGTPNTSDNCGVCGHDCRGGECINGATCGPSNLAIGQQAPSGLGLDETHVYWTNQVSDGSVSRVPKTGGEVEVLASGQAGAFDVALDESWVYFSLATAGGVSKVPKTGGTVVPLATGQVSAVALTIDADSVYWTTVGPTQEGAVRRADKSDGGNLAELALDPGYLYAMTELDGYVYWTNRTTLRINRIRTDGSQSMFEEVAQTSAPPAGIVDYQGDIYWTQSDGSILRWQGSGAPTQIAKHTSEVRDFAGHSSGFYVTVIDDGLIQVLEPDSTRLETLVAGQESPHDIVVDDLAIYWTNWAGTTVKQLVR